MKSRRAISSVVGALFAIIALATTIGYVTYSLNVLADFNENTLVRNQQDLDTTNEKMEVVNVAITGGKFDITVQNTGNVPLNITRLWVTNASATNWVSKYDMDKAAFPGQTVNIGQDIPLTAKSDKSYDMKIVTDRGNTKEFSINNPGSAPIDIKLYALPNTVPDSFTATILMTVTNNMSSSNTLLNIAPQIPLGTSGLATVTLNSGPQPSSYPTLRSGQTAYFAWIYKIEGTGGQSKTFTAQLSNGYPGNTATATVTLNDIPFSLESGSSLESQGLSASLLPQTLLLLHQETQDALDGRQMYSGSGDNPTTLDTSTTQTFKFYTKNDTLSDIDIIAGKWNATLRMISKAVPDTNPAIPTPSLIYHFGSDTGTTTLDSSGNAKDMTFGTGGAKPTWGVSSGVNSTGGYSFDGGDYMEGPTVTSGIDDIAGQPDSTTGWFKTTSTSSARKVIYRVGSGTSEWYEIVMGDGSNAANAGKVYFQYSTTAGDGAPQGKCVTSSSYNNGNWHHFAAVRYDDYKCRLYIDTILDGEDILNDCPSCAGQGLTTVSPSGKTTIGRNPQNSTDYFIGDLDQIFHFNGGSALSLYQVQKMKAANYGANAHKLDFKLERINSTNTVVYETLKSDTAYAIPFWDGKGSTSTASYSVKEINYTTGIIGPFEFNSSSTPPLFHDRWQGDRLKLTVTKNSATSLNTTIRIDDPNMSNPPSSFVQTPSTDEPWPAYYILDNDNNPEVIVYNYGPTASWVSYLTRLTFDDISSTNSYGAHIKDACNSSMDNTGHIRKDSPLIKVGDTCTLKFERPRNPPDAQAAGETNIIPPGQYRVNIFMSGYDETGKIFLRTSYVGIIRVID